MAARRPITGIIAVLALLSAVAVAVNIRAARASSTIYVRADGSIDPPTAPISTVDNVTYTLTGNVTSDAYDGIVVERDNIMVDGAGFAVEGTGEKLSVGIYLREISKVTIRNTDIRHFDYGIEFDSSSNNSVSGNTITNNGYGGVLLASSSNNSVSGNTITSNFYGIRLGHCSNNSISGNIITDNGDDGIWVESSSNNSISGNIIADNRGGIHLEYSSNNSISGNDMTNNGGIWLYGSSYNNVSGNTFTDRDGLYVWDSFSLFVENNTVNGRPLVYLEGVTDHGVGDAGQVVLVRCERIRVEGLNLSRTSIGAELFATNNSIISGNTITANSNDGIWLEQSSNNSINRNNITNNDVGIWLFDSSNNSIDGNDITNNNDGINLHGSSNNTIHHNNFNNNTIQVNDYQPQYTNFWVLNDCEGNFWSNYNGTDLDNDGVGDTYLPCEGVDNYPLRLNIISQSKTSYKLNFSTTLAILQ